MEGLGAIRISAFILTDDPSRWLLPARWPCLEVRSGAQVFVGLGCGYRCDAPGQQRFPAYADPEAKASQSLNGTKKPLFHTLSDWGETRRPRPLPSRTSNEKKLN